MKALPDLAASWPHMPEGVTDRAADVWEPVLAVADAAGGDWPQRARVAAVALVAAAMASTPSLGIRLLADVCTLFISLNYGESQATHVLLEDLRKMDETPWADLRGKALDARGLANLLRPYGVASRNVRIGLTVVRGYARQDFHDPWSRYLGDPAKESATSATPTTPPATTDPVPSDEYYQANRGE